MAEEMKRMRAQMEEDEQVASLMRGLRGQNLSDELFASADTQLRLVEVGLFMFHSGFPPLLAMAKKLRCVSCAEVKYGWTERRL